MVLKPAFAETDEVLFGLHGRYLVLAAPAPPFLFKIPHVPTWRDCARVVISFRVQRTFVAQLRWSRDRTARTEMTRLPSNETL